MTIASFDFEIPGFVATGRCWLTIETKDATTQPSVVCSQKRNYTGTSITNVIEYIAQKLYVEIAKNNFPTAGTVEQEVVKVLREYWKSQGKPKGLMSLYGRSAVRWIEHYPKGTGLSTGESFREVIFDAADSPLWQSAFDEVEAGKQFGEQLIAAAVKVTQPPKDEA